jgi:hypothetical protein
VQIPGNCPAKPQPSRRQNPILPQSLGTQRTVTQRKAESGKALLDQPTLLLPTLQRQSWTPIQPRTIPEDAVSMIRGKFKAAFR